MKQNKKAGRMIIIFLAVFCLALVPVLAEDYSGTFNLGRLSAEGNSSNYTLTLFDEIPSGITAEGNSSNYTVTFEAFDYDADPNIPPPPVEEEPEEEKKSSSSSSTSSYDWPTTPTTEDGVPVEEDISFGVLVSSEDKTITIENKKEGVVLEEVEIKLVDNVTGEKRNVLIQIVQVGETKTRQESLSFFGHKYRMLEIQHDSIDNDEIKSAKIAFSVLDTWLQEQRITKDDVLLFRFNNGEWQELKTAYEDHNSTHHFYSGLSPGLSSFMIGTREDVVQQIPNKIPDITGRVTGGETDNTPSETNTDTAATTDTNSSETITDDEVIDINEGKIFGLKKAIAFLFIGILLAVLIIAGTAFAMKHKHLHPKPKTSQQNTGTQQQAQTAQVQKAQQPQTDFVDTLVEHLDAKAKEIEHNVEQVKAELHPKPTTGTPQQAMAQAQVTTRSVRQPNTQAPKELDFQGHEEESLTQYVKQVISAGYSKELYMKALSAKGWTPGQIDYCVKKVEQEKKTK